MGAMQNSKTEESCLTNAHLTNLYLNERLAFLHFLAVSMPVNTTSLQK
jgi:hypothetical protein